MTTAGPGRRSLREGETVLRIGEKCGKSQKIAGYTTCSAVREGAVEIGHRMSNEVDKPGVGSAAEFEKLGRLVYSRRTANIEAPIRLDGLAEFLAAVLDASIGMDDQSFDVSPRLQGIFPRLYDQRRPHVVLEGPTNYPPTVQVKEHA